MPTAPSSSTAFFYREDRYFIISVAVLVGVLVVCAEVRMRPWLVAAVAPPALLFLFRVATFEDFTVAGHNTPDNCHHDGRPD